MRGHDRKLQLFTLFVCSQTHNAVIACFKPCNALYVYLKGLGPCWAITAQRKRKEKRKEKTMPSCDDNATQQEGSLVA